MKVLRVFVITFVLVLAAQVILNLTSVQDYIKQEIRAAKLMNVMIKYDTMIKPEGLEG